MQELVAEALDLLFQNRGNLPIDCAAKLTKEIVMGVRLELTVRVFTKDSEPGSQEQEQLSKSYIYEVDGWANSSVDEQALDKLVRKTFPGAKRST